MKFSAVITLFVATATAAPLLGDAAAGALGTAVGVLSNPTADVGKLENTVDGLVGSVGKNADNPVGNTENVANGLLGSVGGLIQPVTGLLKPVTDLLEPITGTVGGLLGGAAVKS